MPRKKKTRAKNPQLNQAAVAIGTAIGKAELVARALSESAQQTRKELLALKKTMRALAREADRARRRVKRALR